MILTLRLLTHAPGSRPERSYSNLFIFVFFITPCSCRMQVGVDAGDRELLAAIAERATVPKETCHSEPFKVTALGVRDAMLAADMLGRQYMAVHGSTSPVL